MQIQKSFESREVGTLYIVPTPIGNLEDITYRALSILKSSHVIAAEDTRNTKKLLNYFDIHVPLISYHEYSEMTRDTEIVNRLQAGEQVAIVSDAGMPAISDPGSRIVAAAIAEDLPVVVLPGASAALCAVVGSGLDTNRFLFYGFLPRKKKERKHELEGLRKERATLIFYESPHRLKEMLFALSEVLGNRRIALARELTKKFEEYVRGSVEEILHWVETTALKGEFVVIVEGASDELIAEDEVSVWWKALSIEDHVEQLMEEDNISSKEAIKRVATERNLPKREVYQAYHIN